MSRTSSRCKELVRHGIRRHMLARMVLRKRAEPFIEMRVEHRANAHAQTARQSTWGVALHDRELSEQLCKLYSPVQYHAGTVEKLGGHDERSVAGKRLKKSTFFAGWVRGQRETLTLRPGRV